MPKFPHLIHVTREALNNGDSWLNILTDGVFSDEQAGQPVAIYRLVEVGHIQIVKSLIPTRPAKKKK